jgi:polyisoprenoid-binding protein YceI
MGLTSYTARFTKFDAKLTFNAADVEESNLTASVWLDSVKTDYPDSEKIDFDEELSVEKKWFNTRKFSQAHFVTNSLKRTSKTTGIMEGTLTFLGISKPLEFNVIFNKGYRKMPFSDEPALGVSATATLNRSDWGMTAFIPYVGDNVDLILELEFHQVSSSASG